MIWLRLYSAIWYLITPLIKRYLAKRARLAPDYLEHWDERFGKALQARARGVIWVHAVSVGETRAAFPLIQALRQQWPDAPLLITQMTPTGRRCAHELYGADAEIRYLPYDYPQSVDKFFSCYQPLFGVLMETELWPNLIDAAYRHQVPLFLVNARLSAKSLRGYQKIGLLIRPAMQKLAAIAAQSDEDAARLRCLSAGEVLVCGNTKYDCEPPAAQRQLAMEFRQRIGARTVLVCASTRQGEEALILQAWKQQAVDSLLVMVPRHPERFTEVTELARKAGFKVQRRSDQKGLDVDTQVWIGDSMGELFAYYGAADIVFVGGSLLPFGGQNLIEPASLGLAVLMGPSTFNFSAASRSAFSAGAACQVADANELLVKFNNLLIDENQRRAMQRAALEYSIQYRGASLRIRSLIKQVLQNQGKNRSEKQRAA
jgi:3-deoxy-D-manno-octulosonic-acid transferase